MQVNKATFEVENIQNFKQQMLSWSNQFNISCFLDNNDFSSPTNSYECLAAIDVKTSITIDTQENAIDLLDAFLATKETSFFGHINYDFKDLITPFQSQKKSKFSFPKAFFFQPKTIIKIIKNTVFIDTFHVDPNEIFSEINSFATGEFEETVLINVKATESKESYIDKIENIKRHIKRGDCYELNYCQEFYAENVSINTEFLFWKLSKKSPTPFASYYKYFDNYVLCASPERYVKKQGNTIISQPIKGTIKKDNSNKINDEKLKSTLLNSQKDKSENVMVVDMVRNDLSQICTRGSIKVDELYGIYSFAQVHQMISTISGDLMKNISFAQVLQKTFPMGSMTGAPKKRVMELIEKYEPMQRGLYSGSIGYINEDGDFDFNVVIRSIMYNKKDKYLSYMVGGGITNYSIAEEEYNECLLKAKAIQEVLNNL